MGIFSEIFSWWGGNTWSNRIYTGLRGRQVGTDDMGNCYYEQSKGVGPVGKPRRWVIYKDLAEASFIPPGWHGWMHYTTDVPPTDDAASHQAHSWEQPHRPNMTGTSQAYRPAGSVLAPEQGGGKAPGNQNVGDYQSWKPD